jgi:hypothetical protein
MAEGKEKQDVPAPAQRGLIDLTATSRIEEADKAAADKVAADKLAAEQHAQSREARVERQTKAA